MSKTKRAERQLHFDFWKDMKSELVNDPSLSHLIDCTARCSLASPDCMHYCAKDMPMDTPEDYRMDKV